MNCKQCVHKQNPDGGWCYMFRHQPTGNFCAQFNASDTIRQRLDVVRMMQRGDQATLRIIEDVVEHLKL